MSTVHDLPLLNQLLESVLVVQERAADDRHLADPLVADAILWRTGIIVQTSDRLPHDIVQRHPEVDWRALTRLHQVADGALGGLTRGEVWLTLARILGPLGGAVEQEIASLTRPEADDGRVRRVLLVDDDSDIRHILDLLLTHNGFAVIEAADGAEALKHAVERAPDAVVADVQMPVMDGIELIKRLRAMPSMARVPVLLFTGKPPDAKLQSVLALDRVRYMSKGDPRRISDALKQMFDEAVAPPPPQVPLSTVAPD